MYHAIDQSTGLYCCFCKSLFWVVLLKNFWNIFQCLPWWLHWNLLMYICCKDSMYHIMITLDIETGRRVPFDWLIIDFFCVQFYQLWHCWNLMLWMLADYLDDDLLVGSWMVNGLRMLYQYLVFCARFWVFHWKVRIHAHCCSRGNEVDCRWLFHCLLQKSIFRHWVVGRGQWLVWMDSNVQLCGQNWLWDWSMWWFPTQCIGE